MLTMNGSLPILSIAGISLVLYLVGLAIYRIYLSPLSKFPGPKLAALTKWYEFYYEVYLQGKFVFKIDELHKKYGPIVRITPFELHVADPDFYTELFGRTTPQMKYDYLANAFNNATSVFATVPHDLHKMRRGALEPMFTRQSVRALLPLLQEKTAKLMSLLKAYEHDQAPCRIDRGMWALSEDMIFEYSFGIERGAMEKPGFSDPLHEVFVQAGGAGALMLQFPILPKIMNLMPDSLVASMQPDFVPLINMRRSFEAEYQDLLAADKSTFRSEKIRRTVFVDLLNNPELPQSEKAKQRFIDEAQLVIGAGLSTTGWAATVAIYYILATPGVLAKLREEIYTVIPKGSKKRDCTDLDWAAFEKLPYFQACIRESLRFSYGMSARNSRRAYKDIVYTESDYMTTNKPRSWQIPAHTPISMSIPIVNHNEHVFKDPYAFVPERWIGPDKVPEKYFVTFSKGPRMCLGMQLAWAELSLMLGALFRWYDVELYETSAENVRMAHDALIPVPHGKNGVRIKIRKELE